MLQVAEVVVPSTCSNQGIGSVLACGPEPVIQLNLGQGGLQTAKEPKRSRCVVRGILDCSTWLAIPVCVGT